MYKCKYRKTVGAVLFLVLVLIDQMVKYGIRTRGGFYICNADLAFGFKLSEIFILFVVIILIYFLVLVRNFKFKSLNTKQIKNANGENSKHRFKKFGFKISNLGFRVWPAILIVAGALSNIFDRIFYGCVIDFIDLHFWPVFNLADIYITIGGITIAYKLIKRK